MDKVHSGPVGASIPGSDGDGGAAKRRKLSRREAHRIALHYAICERDGFAEAYGPGDPYGARAAYLAAELRRVLREEFGEITREDKMAQDRSSVSILDLLKPRDA